jgi:acyl-coenzyme A synthetase/AMP-(fatty) acid ligase
MESVQPLADVLDRLYVVAVMPEGGDGDEYEALLAEPTPTGRADDVDPDGQGAGIERGCRQAVRRVEDVCVRCVADADADAVVPDEKWGEVVKAVVSLEGTATEQELIAFCREHLAAYKCPKTVDIKDDLPRNPTGKILKKDLRKPFWEGRDRATV